MSDEREKVLPLMEGGGPGGTRNDFVAENGFKIRKGSNHIGFELLLTMIAVSTNSLVADILHMTVGVDWAGCDVVTILAHT
jgi:hypothetical protein